MAARELGTPWLKRAAAVEDGKLRKAVKVAIGQAST
jgi:hypothetical protein